jgi:hypothetical protein
LKSPRQRYLLQAITVTVAAFVLMLAWPRVMASFRYLPVEHALDRYYRTLEIPTDRLSVLIRFAEAAMSYTDHHRYHEGLSLLHYLRAIDIYTPALDRIGEYRAAETEAAETLRRAPAQPAAWLRMAYIRWILRDEPSDIIEPWKMSIFTGRMDSALILQRVEVGLAYRNEMDAEGMAMLRDQLLLAWQLQPGSLIQVLRARDRGLAATRALIGATDPAALAEMETWLEKLR